MLNQGQTCKVCGRRDKFNFHVPDEFWERVVPPEYQNHVVCLSCFDDFAAQKGIDYSGAIKSLHFVGEQVAFGFIPVLAIGPNMKVIKLEDDEQAIEKLASLEHEQWMEWAKAIMLSENLSPERRDRWASYLIPYDELPDKAKDADRRWALEALQCLSELLTGRL